MLTFHDSYHSNCVLSKDGRTASRGKDGEGATVYIRDPVRPGSGFTFSVSQKPGKKSSVCVGVTSIDPKTWEIKGMNDVTRMRGTWCVDTEKGAIMQDGRDNGVSTRWRDRFGESLRMRSGDKVTFSLNTDGSASLGINDVIINSILTEIQDTSRWAFVIMHVKLIHLKETAAKVPDDIKAALQVAEKGKVVGSSARSQRKKGGEPASIRSAKVVLKKYSPPDSKKRELLPTSDEQYDDIIKRLQETKIEMYPLLNTSKGRACIISIPEYEVDWLSALQGFRKDEDNLAWLWYQTGFDVYLPRVEGRSLSAEEIHQAVETFCQTLTEEDNMAVICFLSHGSLGYMYGCDGRTVEVATLVSVMEDCPKMKGKPKLFMVQTRDEDYSGHPVHLGLDLDEFTPMCKRPPLVPDTSDGDIAVCTTVMPGYLYCDASKGSVFVNTFKDIFSKNCCSTEFHELLSKVAEAVGRNTMEHCATDRPEFAALLQVVQVTRRLRKNLYFLPVSQGRQGFK